jgi:hypothetical protein
MNPEQIVNERPNLKLFRVPETLDEMQPKLLETEFKDVCAASLLQRGRS